MLSTFPETGIIYRPRDGLGPADLLDFTDRHIARATESNYMHERYVALIREFRRFCVSVLLAVSLVAMGIFVAVLVIGLSPGAAAGVGMACGVSVLLAGGRVAKRRFDACRRARAN